MNGIVIKGLSTELKTLWENELPARDYLSDLVFITEENVLDLTKLLNEREIIGMKNVIEKLDIYVRRVSQHKVAKNPFYASAIHDLISLHRELVLSVARIEKKMSEETVELTNAN